MLKNVIVFMCLTGALASLSGVPALATVIPAQASWAERMALSDMQRNPEPWQIDFRDTPKWNYTHGLLDESDSR